jgi:hypothetical protein
LRSAKDAGDPARLLEASSVLAFVRWWIVVVLVPLYIVILHLARVEVIAVTTSAATATTASCGVSTSGVGALSTPALLMFLAELLELEAVLCAVGVYVMEDIEGTLAALAWSGSFAAMVMPLLMFHHEDGRWLALGGALYLGVCGINVRVRDIVGEEAPLLSLGALFRHLKEIDSGGEVVLDS